MILTICSASIYLRFQIVTMKHTITLLAIVCSTLFSFAQQQNCLSFDGTDDYVSCALPTVFTDLANNDFTFEAWINMESYTAGRVFFAQQDASNFATMLLNNGYILFYVKVANSTYTRGVNIPPTGEWVHIAATWDASVLFPSIYVNGELQVVLTGGTSSSGINNTLTIGSRTDGAQPFFGKMDEVRIWNTARNECDIRSMMHSIPAGNEADLIHHYNFNRGTAGGNNPTFTVLPDLVGVNPCTLMNFALSGSTSNWVSSTAPLTAVGLQNAYETNDTAAICEGDTYTLGTQNLTTTGVYQETFTSMGGCDSLVTLQLTVHAAHTPPVTEAACTSYFWTQTGETYFTSGIYTDTLISSYGCDSILTLDLTINQPTASSQQVDACGSYTWVLNGEIYTASGLYHDTIPNAAGCDSVITLELTILEPTASTVTASACGSYYWGQTGLTYNFSGVYKDTILNAAGCDSVITLSLLIHQIPQGTIVYDGQGTLSVNTIGEVVDWIDCTTGETIPGQQGQSNFTPIENGSYAAIVENTMTLCRDTTDCFTVGFVNVSEHPLIDMQITPNPTHDRVTLSFSGETASLIVLDSQGKQVVTQTVENGAQIPLVTLEPGIYLFRLQTTYGIGIQRVVKQ